MHLHRLAVSGYRSLRDISVGLGPINVFTGPNGCGKTNLYRAIWLLAEAARGRLARALADEGGMPSALWAGAVKISEQRRIMLRLSLGEFSYELACGLPAKSDLVADGPLPGQEASYFQSDPLIKSEYVWIGPERTRGSTLLERKHSTVFLRDADQRMVQLPGEIDPSESVLAQIQQPHLYPKLALLQRSLLAWRFYHHFRTDPAAPARQPQVPVRTPVLADDGGDLANALRTILELGDFDALRVAIDDAFPGGSIEFPRVTSPSMEQIQFYTRLVGIDRPLVTRELSDGTLRYLCLIAALLAPRPASFLALNEPETSLHPDLLPHLARLIVTAASRSQVWITTHSALLADEIERLSGNAAKRLHLDKGETRISLSSVEYDKQQES